LLLDTGDALIGGGILGDATKGEVIVAGMSAMGYDAMTLGPKELSMGVEVLGRRVAEAEFPMLSANVVLTGTETLFAEPYTIVEVGGHRVGIIGLTRVPSQPRPGFQILKPQDAAARYAAEVSTQAGTIIVLTNMKYRQALKLAKAVPDIDLVVSALPGQLPEEVAEVAETGAIVVTAEQPVKRHTGRRVGRLAVTLESDGSLSDPSWTTKWMDKKIADDAQMTELLNGFR
jgi:2',3'-cyclic-nucleotide 2'-phosphodiesterase (5'-nucleotidase family)